MIEQRFMVPPGKTFDSQQLITPTTYFFNTIQTIVVQKAQAGTRKIYAYIPRSNRERRVPSEMALKI